MCEWMCFCVCLRACMRVCVGKHVCVDAIVSLTVVL